jgi:hypothetical protein
MQERRRIMFRKTLTTLVLGIALAAGGSLAMAEPKVPATPEDHFALAKAYKEKAETYRKEARRAQEDGR